MPTRITVLGVVLGFAACAPAPSTPEQEAADFLQAVASCISDNREAFTASIGQRVEVRGPWDELCDMDPDDLSPPARELAEESMGTAFGEMMSRLMGAAFSGDESTATPVVDAMADAFADVAEQLRAGQGD